jgi:glycolate oxidase
MSSAADPRIDQLVRRLGNRVIVDPDRAATYGRDSSRAEPDGIPAAVVRAESTHDVSLALAWANEHGVPTAVRGAGTGLAGGAVAYAGGLTVSTEGLTARLEIDTANRLAIASAGILTKQIDDRAGESGLMYGPDPASYAISTIGGNIATNAGGLRCVAHGVTADSVAGLEVVLADGRIMRTGGSTRKNVAGYDLTHLFVGSEGTLGVVCEATLRLTPLPRGTRRCFTARFATASAAARAVSQVMAGPITPNSLELLDASALAQIAHHVDIALSHPAGGTLVGDVWEVDAEGATALLADTFSRAGALEVEITGESALLGARRFIGAAQSAAGLWYSCDVAVPVSALPLMFERLEAFTAETGVPVATVAHAGDGNLHATLNSADLTEAEAEGAMDGITLIATGLGGTVSGEHGIGILKHPWLADSVDPVALQAMRTIRQALDPRGILSPGRAI